LSVWYDEFEMRIGDSLRRKIDKGLANSRFGATHTVDEIAAEIATLIKGTL
jgi:hypothetical protein